MEELKEEIHEHSSESLTDKIKQITSKFNKTADFLEDLDDTSNQLEEIVSDVMETSTDIKPINALNLTMLIEDFKYVRHILKTNADAGRMIIQNVTESILNFDGDNDDNNNSLADKALLISSFADINKSVAINMDLYLKTYKEISSILVHLSNIKDITSELNDEEPIKDKKKENEINTLDLIKQLNNDSEYEL